jgi:hypothetical protein
MQNTPQSWGRVYWSGGAGKEGEMGGWRFHCNWCNVGDTLTAFPRKHVADNALGVHCVQNHSYKTEVRALLPGIHRDDAMNARCNGCEHLVRQCICLPSTTGAADVEANPTESS